MTQPKKKQSFHEIAEVLAEKAGHGLTWLSKQAGIGGSDTAKKRREQMKKGLNTVSSAAAVVGSNVGIGSSEIAKKRREQMKKGMDTVGSKAKKAAQATKEGITTAGESAKRGIETIGKKIEERRNPKKDANDSDDFEDPR